MQWRKTGERTDGTEAGRFIGDTREVLEESSVWEGKSNNVREMAKEEMSIYLNCFIIREQSII